MNLTAQRKEWCVHVRCSFDIYICVQEFPITFPKERGKKRGRERWGEVKGGKHNHIELL